MLAPLVSGAMNDKTARTNKAPLTPSPAAMYSTSEVDSETKRSVSIIGRGGDTTIPSPRRSPKQPLPGIGLHNPLHGRQACPEFKSFHQGSDQISLREGLFSCRPLLKRGKN